MPKGKLIEFPRKLEWNEVVCYVGKVKGTELHTRVEIHPDGTKRWQAWDRAFLVGCGDCDDLEDGQEKAKKALEDKCVVVRRL
jgi:hypothetical protein